PAEVTTDGVAPGPAALATTAAAPTVPAAAVQEVPPTDTNPSLADILGGTTPLGNLSGTGNWSLLSLLMAIAGALSSLVVAVTLFIRKRRDEEGEEGQTPAVTEEEAENDNRARKRGLLVKAATIVLGLFAGFLFLVLDDLSQPVALINQWTLWVAVPFVAHLLLVAARLVARKQNPQEKQPQEEV
ncbi:hypothetical protein LJC49_09060, partial [Ruminococcaceae bacterium OttesenSCG-928-I18]|nr:hypothetical protein [Ruminococcaceae bacterium OttesenSCG-928-I18]